MASNFQFHTIQFTDVQFTVPVHYTNIQPVGTGSQGMVCSAYDELKQRNVAIKKLSRPFQNVVQAKLAYRELKLLRLVSHKNIIQLLDVFTPDQTLQDFQDIYLVTELMETSFSKLLYFEIDHDHLSFLIYQILCGVKHLHSAGIIHRDLKPANIMVKSDCSLKILDLGLARINAGDNQMLTAYVVTRYYRAPEVILGMRYNENVDIWSIGCIFAEVLRNRILFRGENNIDQWNKIIELLGTPPQSFINRLSPNVQNYLKTLPHFEGYSIEQLFPDALFSNRGNEESDETKGRTAEARDLLGRMLQIDPDERITVDEALRHSYFSFWYKEDEVNGPAPRVEDHMADAEEHTVEEWRNLMYDELIRGSNRGE